MIRPRYILGVAMVAAPFVVAIGAGLVLDTIATLVMIALVLVGCLFILAGFRLLDY